MLHYRPLLSSMNIDEWLRRLRLEQYASVFRDNEITTDLLPTLTADDLKDLGVRLVGHRRRLLDATRALNSLQAQPAITGGHAAAPQTEGERRQLTVLFCDLVGSTALASRLDPEDLRELVQNYHTCITEVIRSHQGSTALFLGDGVLAYFGFPLAHEDDPEQAVHAGLALVGAVKRLPVKSATQLQVRIGIATGTVVIGELVGQCGAPEASAFGRTPNLAARLQAIAQPGEVLICSTTRQLAAGHFEYRELPAASLKGFAEPVRAWKVLRPSGIESRFEARHSARLTQLLGREEEIELLSRRWGQAARGRGCAVVLSGEPGIGKSHITLAFENHLQSEPHTRLRLFCSAHHTNSALYPFITQLERAAHFERGESVAAKLSKLEALLSRTLERPEDAVSPIADLLSLPAHDRYAPPEENPQRRKEKIFSALMSRLQGLSVREPALVIFEDAHWADPTSLEFLALALEQLPQFPVLLLITARPEFVAPWPSHAHLTSITLNRLNRRDGAALIELVTEGKRLPGELRDQILARTDGIPLFVEELTKTVLESGLLQEQQGRNALDHQLLTTGIPTTLHASLMARLDRSAEARDIAQIGAAIGREFSFELLRAVATDEGEKLDAALRQLVRLELLLCRGQAPRTVYTFRHALVRDAAYAGLLRTRRAKLHAAIARALEQQSPEAVETQPEILAYHHAEAGHHEKAVAYRLQAGRNAAARSANLEAIAHLQLGLETLVHLPPGVERHRIELDFRLLLAPCLIATQGPASAAAMASFARAREVCKRLNEPPEYLQVMFWLTTASVIRGELPKAYEAITDLIRLAEARQDRPALLNAIRGRAMILLFMGRLVEARRETERAVAAFNTSSDADQLAARAAGQDAGVAGLALMSWALWLLGDVDEAVAKATAARERAEVVQHPHSQAYAHYYASVLHALLGQPEIANWHAKRCLTLSEDHGFRQWRGLSRAVQGVCAAMLDPNSNPLDDVAVAMNEYFGSGYQLGITALYVLLCPALLRRGRADAALDFAERGLSIVAQNDERLFEAELYRLKARALRLDGGPNAQAEADSLLERGHALAQAQGARSLELRTAIDLATSLRDQAGEKEALAILQPVCGWFDEGLSTRDLEEARALIVSLGTPHVDRDRST
jgi:class 3 adenylate cyclase